MDSSQITTEQAAKIKDAIGPAFGYLSLLVRRMERRGFPPDDQLFKIATAAQDRMQHLWITLHYMSIKEGVGRQPKPK
jgi:hypothetical protein